MSRWVKSIDCAVGFHVYCEEPVAETIDHKCGCSCHEEAAVKPKKRVGKTKVMKSSS